MAAGESSSRPPATLTAPSVARTQNVRAFLQSPSQAGLELHSGALLALVHTCVFTLCLQRHLKGEAPSFSVASWVTWQRLINVNAPPSKKWGINTSQLRRIGAAFPGRNWNHVLLSQAFSQQCVYLHDCRVNAAVWNYTLPTDQPASVAAVTQLLGGGSNIRSPLFTLEKIPKTRSRFRPFYPLGVIYQTHYQPK